VETWFATRGERIHAARVSSPEVFGVVRRLLRRTPVADVH
jgi:hypothetical protein